MKQPDCEKVYAGVTMEDPPPVPKFESALDEKSQTSNFETRKGNSAYRAGDYGHPNDCEAINLPPTVEEKMRGGQGEAEQRSLLGERPKDGEAIRPLPEVEKITEGHGNKGEKILIEEDNGSGEDTFTSLKREGYNLVINRQYQDAADKYSRCLEMKPDDPVVHGIRAQCYLRLGRFAEAKRDCDASLASEARAKMFYWRAVAHKGLRDYPACIHDLEATLRCEPDTPEAEKLLGTVLILHLHSITASLHECKTNAAPVDVKGDGEMENVAEVKPMKRRRLTAPTTLSAASGHG